MIHAQDDDYESDSSEILCAVCNESADVKGNRIVVCDNEDCGNVCSRLALLVAVCPAKACNVHDWAGRRRARDGGGGFMGSG
jgi:hypothetical protein